MKRGKIYIYIWRLFCVLLASATIALFWKDTLLVSILLLILAFFINFKSSKIEIFFYLIVAVLATIVESITISTGAWIYTNQHILNFPIWLPLYWGMGGVIMKDVYLILMEKTQRKKQ